MSTQLGRLSNRSRAARVLAGAVLLCVGPVVWSAERSVEPLRCVQLSRIDSVDVLSNRQIVFKLDGNQYYVNTLPYPCPGLRRNTPIMYRTSIDQLCSVDVVTVLQSMGGGAMPGASCGLGMFEPIDKDELDALREQARAGK